MSPSNPRGNAPAVRIQSGPVLALALVVLLVTSPVAAAVPSGSLAAGAANAPTATPGGEAEPTTSAPVTTVADDAGTATPAGNTNSSDASGGELSPVVADRDPTDPDGDGRYEDVDGDGEVTVVDSQALLAHLDDAAVREHASQYDFTGDGATDVSDVQWLYVRVVEPTERDADGDGLNNTREVELGTDAFATDTDGDGIGDWTETDGGDPVDTDGDGTIDARDEDSDGDGVPDGREGTNDTDGDGTPDYRDGDDDGDGIPTAREVADGEEFVHDVDFDGTPNWLDADADGDGEPDSVEGTTDADGDGMPDYLDNDADDDGLPDFYERNVTGTDPTNNDSDSSETARDESDNDVIDGMEDFDGDTLGTHREYVLGTDPFENDTDGDGLSDGFEARTEGFDPLDPDTDGDGTLDGAGDRDGDGLTNAREAELGTLVDVVDTDGDGLSDGREVELGTDPKAVDTDDDWLPDAEERSLGTDPLDPDTNDDGVVDGNETYETVTRDDETGVSLSLRGEGDVANEVNVTAKPTYFEGHAARAGPTVRVVNRTTFTNATVEIPVDDAADPSNLSVYKWNGSARDTWTAIDSTVENGTARAEVDSFSYFTVLDSEEWTSATRLDAVGDPIALGNESVSCSGACEVANDSTLLLGGEPTARTIVVEQGDREHEITTMSNGQTIEDFYNYGNAQVNSPLPIFESDTTRVFVWSGPNGRSLVLLHDHPSDGTGGAVTTWFDELPRDEGSWVVRDDDPGNDNYASQRASWHWSGDKTDGGAFRGGLANESVTLSFAFNDDALVDDYAQGRMTDLAVLTGQATDPDPISLAMDEPVTFHFPDRPDDASNDDGLSGDTGSATIEREFDATTESLALVYQTEQTNENPEASVEVTGPNGTTVSESLTVGTVGTVLQQINTSELAPGQTTVSLSAEGVNLRGEVVPQETVDSDGDGIPDRLEERTWTMPTGSGATFSTDPTDPDTDGDGIPDGEEVRFEREVIDGDLTVTPVVESNPTRVDTDSDGLGDQTEREGWSISIASTADQGDSYADARQNGGDATGVLTTMPVTADPLQADTDGDGLDDFEEYRAGTNPNSRDTDDDGNGDRFEYHGNDVDPAIHDHEAPSIMTEAIRTNGDRTSYTAEVALRDQSGVEYVTVYVDGENEYTNGFEGPEDTGYRSYEFTVERDTVDRLFTTVESYVTSAAIDVEPRDVHDNEKRRTVEGADSFGQAARVVAESPVDVGETDVVALMSFSSGIATAANEAIVGIAELISDPVGWAEQMAQLAQTIWENPGILTKLPGMMADQIEGLHETRNPFDSGDDQYVTFGGGWSLGYSAGMVLPSAASGGSAGVLNKGLSASRKLQRVVDAADSAVPSRVPNGLKPGVLRQAGQVDDALPDANVQTGRLGGRLTDLSGPQQRQVVDQFDELDGPAKRHLADSDVDAPAAKSARLFERAGPDGRRALNDLAETDPDAADALLKIDDAGTQRAMVRALEGERMSQADIATALKRYDEMGPEGKRFVRESMAETDQDTVGLLTIDVCNSPCDDPVTSAIELGRTRGGLDNTETKRLAKAIREGGDVATDPGSDQQRVMENLNELAESDNVDGFDDAVSDVSGTSRGYKGVSGEADVAKTKADGGADVTMEEDVGRDDLDDEIIENSDIDSEVGGEDLLDVNDANAQSDIDVKADGTAYESKNVDYEPYADFDDAYRDFGEDLDDLRRKLNTWAASGEDDIVVVVREGQLEKTFDADVRNNFPSTVDDVDNLNKIGQKVESNFDDVDVTFKTYDQVNP